MELLKCSYIDDRAELITHAFMEKLLPYFNPIDKLKLFAIYCFISGSDVSVCKSHGYTKLNNFRAIL